jgi:hypothetical protein
LQQVNPADRFYATYLIVGGSDVTYRMSKTNNIMGRVFTPQDGACGTHGVCGIGSCTGMTYAYVQMMRPTESNSLCNILGQLPGKLYPNNDFALDNAIAVALHEVIESITSPQLKWDSAGKRVPDGSGGGAFKDAYANEPADKCSNMFLNIGQFSNNGNIQVGGKPFIVFPLYHYTNQVCSMA